MKRYTWDDKKNERLIAERRISFDKMAKMDREEREIISSFNKGEWRSVENLKGKLKKYRAYAKETLKKDKRINIRVSSKDLKRIQRIAIAEGLPYQTFIASILHKYVSGRFREYGHQYM